MSKPRTLSKQNILILRLEGLGLLLLSAALLDYADKPLWLLTAAFLLFDVSMIGYLHSHRTGSITYNLVHTYSFPAALAAIGLTLDNPGVIAVAACWLFHVAADRLLGYGLKHPSHFTDTHLGIIGKDKS